MNTKKTKMASKAWPRLQLPVILGSLALGFATGLIIALFKESDSYSRALGDILVIEAFLCFGIAWLGYLKKDGVRLFPGKKKIKADPSESWRDRVPQVGQEPPILPSIPGTEGPESPEYLRLAEAETKLRRRIMGIQDESENMSGSGEPKLETWGFTLNAGLVGAIFLILGIIFAYFL